MQPHPISLPPLTSMRGKIRTQLKEPNQAILPSTPQAGWESFVSCLQKKYRHPPISDHLIQKFCPKFIIVFTFI